MLRDGSRNNDDKYILTQNKEKLSKLTDCDLWSAEFLIVKSVTQAMVIRDAHQKAWMKEFMISLLTFGLEAGHGLQRGFVCPFGFYNF